MASAVKAAAALGVSMLTVHAAGGAKMLRAAAEAVGGRSGVITLAVTVLTSLNQSELESVGVPSPMEDQVLRLASLALTAGCQGIVSSAREAPALRRKLGSEFALVTPGVRPAGGDVQDQARVVTPAQAIAAGASHIVVGRPITGAADPAAAAEAILSELATSSICA